MSKVILEIEGTQMIETLKEINCLLDEITPKVERLRKCYSNFVTIAPTINVTKGFDIDDVLKNIEKRLSEEIEQSAKSIL